MVKISLTCVIVGAAGGVFEVDIDAGQTVGELKDAIEKKKMYQFPADEMQLFLAKTGNKWLDGADAAAVELKDDGILRGVGDPMDAALLLKYSKHFGANFQPVEEFGEIVEARVNKVLDDRDKKRSVYSLSDLHTEHREKMAKKIKLVDDYITFNEPTPLPNAGILPYTWLDAPEDADNQRAKYMTYLETHLKTVLDERRLSLLDVSEY